MPEMPTERQLRAPVDVETYRKIRRLWIQHSKAEDRRDLEGLIRTLAPDCVYEIVTTGQRWEGHEGARAFYTEFLGAFPDVKFELRDIVIGPQGVVEVADMVGTHQGPWAGMPPSGQAIRLRIIIHFPWDPEAGLFAGERIYYDRQALADQAGEATT